MAVGAEDQEIREAGDYSIEPYGEKFYGLYKGTELVAVFVYKRGALEVMRRLSES